MRDLPLPDGADVVIPPTLGPGDDDQKSPARGVALEARGPLGPGDDDPRSPVNGTAAPLAPALGPGDAVGENPDDAFDFLAPPAAGPGADSSGPRHVVRVPKQTAPVAATVSDNDKE